MASVMFRSAVVSVALAASSPAFAALGCDEIMKMVDVNVPTTVVVTTIDGSGTRFTAADVKCLTDRGAPEDVVAAAKKLMGSSAAAADDEPAPTRTKAPVEEDDSTSFDKTESLGSTVPAADDSGAEEDDSGGPREIKDLIALYRAKKVLTASKGFFDLLEEGKYPDDESKISYYLAKSLFDLQMFHSAQHYFMEVVRKGPKNPYFKYALPKLVAIAEQTGDDTELLRIVDKIPPESFPRQAKNHLYYLMGRKLYEDEKYVEAAKYFQQVSAKSELYPKAKYYEGIIHNERGKYKSAVKAFQAVFQSDATPTDDRQLREFEDLKDLALMNIARIYYVLDRFDMADNFYSQVDRDSTYWAESLYERAWTQFWQNDLNLSLGLLLTVRSPYYADEDYIPEAEVLRSLAFFNFCEHDETEKILIDFDAKYGPMKDEMKGFLDQYQGESAKKLSDQAYDKYFVEKHRDSKLTKSFFLKILRNRDLADLVHHLDMIDEETALIDAQKDAWKTSVGAKIKEFMAEDQQRYKRKAGLVLLQEMAHEYEYLNNLMTQGEIIRFEVVDAQRQGYEFKMQNPDVESLADRKVDFSTSRKIIYWPFNGEFWQDELGYYRYTEESQCNK